MRKLAQLPYSSNMASINLWNLGILHNFGKISSTAWSVICHFQEHIPPMPYTIDIKEKSDTKCSTQS